MTATMTSKPLSVDEARVLAGDLIRALAERVGDPAAVDAVLARWAETLGPRQFGQVAMATVQTTFRDCLTRVDALPADGIAYTDPDPRRTP